MSSQNKAFYPGGFAAGVAIRGIPLAQTHTGEVFWVYNGTTLDAGHISGSNTNKGTFDQPLSTIDAAVNLCKADRGDIIFVKPGHAESIATAAELVLDVAGVSIIGLGTGSMRPTLTYITNTTANIPVSAANISIQNILFVANVAAVASAITVTGTSLATGLSVTGCEFRDNTSSLNFRRCVTGNATAACLNDQVFSFNRIHSLGTTALTTAVVHAAASSRVQINDNFGVWAVLNDTPGLLEIGANNLLGLEFARNMGTRPNTSSTAGSFLGSSATGVTGYAYDNYFYHADTTTESIWVGLLTGGAFGFTRNYLPVNFTADLSAIEEPIAV